MALASTGVSSRSRAACSKLTPARCSRRCSGSSAPVGSTPSGVRPKTRAAGSSTPSLAPAKSSSSSRPQTGPAVPRRSHGFSAREHKPMSIWRQLTHGLRGLALRGKRNDEAGEEVRHYFEEATAALIARGLSPEDARRVARQQLGSITVPEEQARSYGCENALHTSLSDLRFSVRQLRNHLGFTPVPVLTRALALGA